VEVWKNLIICRIVGTETAVSLLGRGGGGWFLWVGHGVVRVIRELQGFVGEEAVIFVFVFGF